MIACMKAEMQCYIPVVGTAGPEDTEGEVWAGTHHSHIAHTLALAGLVVYIRGVGTQGFGTQVVGTQAAGTQAAGKLGTLVGSQSGKMGTGEAHTMVELMDSIPEILKVLWNKISSSLALCFPSPSLTLSHTLSPHSLLPLSLSQSMK